MLQLFSNMSSDHNDKRLKSHHIAAGALGAVAASYAAMRIYKSITATKLTVPGSNSGYPFIGELFEFKKVGMRKHIQTKHDEFGEIFYLYIMNDYAVILCSPETVAWFESEERKGSIGKQPDPVLGSQGIVNQSGPAHKSSRTMFLKSIGQANLPTIFPMIESCVRRFVDGCLETERYDDFLIPSKSLAWEIGTTLLFGDLISHEESETILELCHEMLVQIQAVCPWALPGTGRWYSAQARREMVSIFEQVLRTRVSNIDTSSGLFIDRLLDEYVRKYKTTNIVPNQMEYMTDQILVFVLGAHETTASTLTNVMVVLDRYPEYKQRLREMYDETDGVLSYAAIKNNPFLSTLVSEIMRVYSISGISTRITLRDVTYKEFSIPKGTKLVPGLHTISNAINDNEGFDSSRVSDAEPTSSVRRGRDFYGFGVGMHNCAGQKLARLELYTTILTLCGRCDWTIDSEPVASKTGIMHHNFRCSFRPRA